MILNLFMFTPHSELGTQFGRLRTDSKTSSYNSNGDESVAFATRIMIAQRHYSALAQTVVVPGGATANRDSVAANALLSTATGATKSRRTSHSSHLRTRSVFSMNGSAKPKSQEDFSISSPPLPLPSTPPNVRAARLAMLAHMIFPFDDINEIDVLTAGVPPVLVPGLTVYTIMDCRTRRNMLKYHVLHTLLVLWSIRVFKILLLNLFLVLLFLRFNLLFCHFFAIFSS
jgi:hypothetical protein